MQGITGASQVSSVTRACLTCRNRKTKCGKEQPSCSQCVSAGWRCPGYKASLRFYHSDIWSLSQHERARKDRSWIRQSSYGSGLRSITLERSIITVGPKYGESDRLRLKFISQMTEQTKNALYLFLPSHTFLHYIPARIGASAALDNAVKCISLATSPDTDTTIDFCRHKELLPGYVNALTSLQRALVDKHTSLAAETLAAVMLLQLAEQFTNTLSTGWIKHAGGAIKLLELRGPRLVDEDIGLAILESQVGRINFECIRTDRESFLALPQWQDLLCRFAISGSPGTGRVSRVEWEYHRIVSHLPGLVKTYVHWQGCLLKEMRSEACSRNVCDLSDHYEFEASMRQNVIRFWIDLQNWRTTNARFICYKTKSTNENLESTLNDKSQPKPVNHRTRLALNCFAPTFTIIATHMLLQVADKSVLGLRQPFKPSTTENRVIVSCNNKEYRIDDLLTDCVACLEVIFDAHTCLIQSFPIPAGLIGESLALLWHKATDLSFQSGQRFQDPILQAIGSLW